MSTLSNTQKASIILNTQEDWREWINVMKRLAKPDDVWQYMNPDIKQSRLPQLEPPVFPTWREIKSTATSYSNLSVDEREAYRDLKTVYHADLKRYEAKSKALSQMEAEIQCSISRTNCRYTLECDNAYEMMIALKMRLQPTNRAREREIEAKIHEIKKGPGSTDVQAWLSDFENIYTEAEAMELPDARRDRATDAFMAAV